MITCLFIISHRVGRRWAAIFTLVILACGALAGAAEVTAQKPPIRSGAEIDYPPFSIVDDQGRAAGFSVELMRAAVAAMGREVTFRTGPWAEVRGWLERGEIEALPLVGRTPERESLFDFTFPYMSLHGAIVVRKGENTIGGLSDLKGRTVAVMKGDNAEEFLRRENRGIHIVTTATVEEAFKALSEGRHDAVVIQRLVALRLIKEMNLAALRVINRPIDGFRQDFCFAVKEGDRDTLALLNEGLALVVADGTYRHLHAKWFAALELPARRRIVVGGDSNYPPYEYLDDSGRPAGYNVDLTRAIAQAVGLDIEIRLGDWDEMVQALENGDIDILQGMFYSPRRDLTFDFSPPHDINHYVAVVPKGSGPAPETLSRLSGRRIAVQRGDVILEHLSRQAPEAPVIVADSQEAVLREVAAGNADCGLIVRVAALRLMAAGRWAGLTLGRVPVFTADYCYAVKKGHKALLAAFAEGLTILEASGEYRQIHDRWLGVYQKARPGFFAMLRYVAMVAVPLLVVVLAVFMWSWSLRKQVARRTRELRDSERRYRLLADNTLDVIWTMNLDFEFTYVNPAITLLTGHSPESWIGSRLQAHCDEDNFAMMADVLLKEMEKGPESTGVIFEAVMLRKDGEPIFVEIHGKVIYGEDGEPALLQGTTRDVMERRHAIQRIEHLNQVLRTIRDVNQLIVRERDRDALIREGCRLVVAHRGYPSALIVLTDDQGRLVSWAMEGLAAASAPLAALLKSGRLPSCCAHAGQAPGAVLIDDRGAVCGRCPIAGACAESQSLCAPLIYEGRAFGYLVAAAESRLTVDAEEISLFSEMAGDFAYALNAMETQAARLQGEAALKESESRFRLFAELAPVGILISDEQENTLYANARFTELFGYTLEDMPSVARWWELAHPDPALRESVRREWASALAQARLTHSEITPLEYPVTCRDGSVRQVEFRMASTGALNVVIFTDISARKNAEAEREKLQARLMHSQKIESVGQLAGGVAHDYNNMLSVIIGYAELAMEKSTPGGVVHAHLSEILAAARRSADITRQLLAFARKQIIAPKVLDLNETVESMLKMLRRLIGEDIDLAWQPGGGLWPVNMDPAQLDQILANLLVNARDAIGGVGRITIETENVTFDDAYCADHAGFAPGQFVLLAVSDDGHGMDHETLDHLFEPFFTTKAIGEGTGLGLATVYGIVRQHEGLINVYSEPEKGTTFRLYFPRYDGDAPRNAAAAPAGVARGRGETVLVVEDEAAILKLAGKILDSLGYTVLSAGTPSAALAAAVAHGGRIDLLLTDVVMPEMSGRDLAERLQASHPELRVLFMSGYTANVIAHRGVLDEGVHFMQKPFSFAELAGKVREAIGQ